MKSPDYVIVGGGLFGSYAALYLARQGYQVQLIEKELGLFRKASVVNQARLHGGYHYPRSIATALMSDDNKARFTKDHEAFINFKFDKYYAIDKYGSLTDAAQFERFCQHIGIPCDRVHSHPFWKMDRLEALYKTVEYSFDPFLIANYYRQQLAKTPNIDIALNSTVISAEAQNGQWLLHIKRGDTTEKMVTGAVINATYAGSNSINQLFGMPTIKLMHEISEILLVTSPQLQHQGITIMDGPFASLMPYGKSGMLSLSSVAYTHHKVSYDLLPTFDCQQGILNCRPTLPGNCNDCQNQPRSNDQKMVSQIRLYVDDKVEIHPFRSLFTIKSKLQANFIDDGRPTEIAQFQKNPAYYCIFAGKINSIYEIEKVLQ